MRLAAFDNVVKEYPQGILGRGRLRAVDGASFEIRRGEVLGLVGPNRAGKTTLIKLLLSLCRPTAGLIERLGRPSGERETLGRIGYVHESPAFPRYLSAEELMRHYGALSGTPEEVVDRRTELLLRRMGIADRAREPISRYSKGMIQRLSLAQALVNQPDLLVLDEPHEGLDLLGRQLVRDTIEELRDAGKGILFVSHVLDEVRTLCDRIVVLVRGQVKFLGTPQELAGPGCDARALENALRPYYQSEVLN